jgi:hypothetical protein
MDVNPNIPIPPIPMPSPPAIPICPNAPGVCVAKAAGVVRAEGAVASASVSVCTFVLVTTH